MAARRQGETGAPVWHVPPSLKSVPRAQVPWVESWCKASSQIYDIYSMLGGNKSLRINPKHYGIELNAI
jgi:hypothetical protein